MRATDSASRVRAVLLAPVALCAWVIVVLVGFALAVASSGAAAKEVQRAP